VGGIDEQIDEQDPSRGTGPEKITDAVNPDLEAPPSAQTSETSNTSQADPGAGGCMRFGWGCLPVLAGAVLIPANLLY
jgi:hypothetical protein